MDNDKKAQKGLQMITHSQGKLTIWLGSCAQNKTKCLDPFHAFVQSIQIKD